MSTDDLGFVEVDNGALCVTKTLIGQMLMLLASNLDIQEVSTHTIYLLIFIKYIHTYVHTYICTYVHMYICTYIDTYIHIYIHTYITTYIHAYVLVCMYIMYVCIYVCTYVYLCMLYVCIWYMHVCMYVYMYVYIYIYIYMQNYTHSCIYICYYLCMINLCSLVIILYLNIIDKYFLFVCSQQQIMKQLVVGLVQYFLVHWIVMVMKRHFMIVITPMIS